MRTRSIAMLVTTTLAATIVAGPLGCAAPSTGEDESTDTVRSALGATCVTIRRGEAGDVYDTFLSGDYPTWAAGADSSLFIGGSTGGDINLESLAALALGTGPVEKVVMCDAVTWRFLGLSMAGWNALISATLAVFSLLAAKRPKDARAPRN